MILEMEIRGGLTLAVDAVADMCNRLGVLKLELCAWDGSFNHEKEELLFMAHLNSDPNRSGYTFVRIEEELTALTGRRVYVRTSGERNMSGEFDAPEVITVLFDES